MIDVKKAPNSTAPAFNKPLFILGFLVVLNLIFIFYCALFPFQGWRLPPKSMIAIVLFDWVDYIFLFDIIQNLLLFLPFSFLAAGYLMGQHRRWQSILLIPTLASFIVSVSLELLQTYNPARIPSLLDIILNTMSGFLGALFAFPLMRYYPRLLQYLEDSIQPSNKQNLWPFVGIAVWLVWACYQTYPFIPTIYPKQLWDALTPILLCLKGELIFSPAQFLYCALKGTMLYFSGKLFLRPERFMSMLIGFIATLFLVQIAIIERYLTLEALLGYFSSIALIAFSLRLREIVMLHSEKIKMEVVE